MVDCNSLTPMKNSPPVDGEGSSVSDEDTRNSISSSVQGTVHIVKFECVLPFYKT